HEGQAIIVAVGRHFSRFTNGGREWPRSQGWHATLVPDGFGSIRDLLGSARPRLDREIPVADLFANVPAAVLGAVPVSRAASRHGKDRCASARPSRAVS